VQLSGVLKRVATKLSKTCNDLRLLSSGPQAGFGDIKLPPRQAGSHHAGQGQSGDPGSHEPGGV
jgi:aspartate ammonia-lyase